MSKGTKDTGEMAVLPRMAWMNIKMDLAAKESGPNINQIQTGRSQDNHGATTSMVMTS